MTFRPVVATSLAGIVSSIVLLCPHWANACSWPEGFKLTKAAVVERFCEADVVFLGKVEGQSLVSDEITESKIWPERVYKGRTGAPAYALHAEEIDTPKQRFCNFKFQPPARYLIFADQYEGLDYLCVSACDLTELYNPDSFTYQIVESIQNVLEECGEEASRKRQADRRREWIDILSQKDKREELEELEEAARQLREADE